MVKYIAKIGSGAETYYLKDIEARASIDDKPGSDDFENLGDALTIQTVDDAIAEAEKSPSVISFSEDTASVDEGSTITKTVTITAGDGAVTYSSSDTDVATVNNSGVVTGVSAGTCTITATIASTSTYKAATASYTLTVIYNAYGDHDYVEIRGIKWATMNIGADSITDSGLYFLWGDTQGYTTSQVGTVTGLKGFNWTDYKYNNDGTSPELQNMTKYSPNDLKTILESSDDAATANWGSAWRTPTIQEYLDLFQYTNKLWTTNYQNSGVAGLICTDLLDNSKVLFFPITGMCYSNSFLNLAVALYYSSSVYDSNIRRALSFTYYGSGSTYNSSLSRYVGVPIRPVAD